MTGTVHSLLQNEGYIVHLDSGKDVIAFNKKYKKPLIIGERIAMKLSRSKKYRGQHGKVTKRLKDNNHEKRILLGIIITDNNEYFLKPVSKKNRHLVAIFPDSLNDANEGDLVHASYVTKDELRAAKQIQNK